MMDTLRAYFFVFYLIGVAVLLVVTLSTATQTDQGEKRPDGLRGVLPIVLAPAAWLLPPLVMFFRFGELDRVWSVVRLVGFGLSLYAAWMLLLAPNTLGRFLVPRAVVFHDHELVTAGPYRTVRHPIYSGVLALWLGAALGTLNLLLLCLWPVIILAFSAEAGIEEDLLRSKFGPAYESYAKTTGRFVPRFSG